MSTASNFEDVAQIGVTKRNDTKTQRPTHSSDKEESKAQSPDAAALDNVPSGDNLLEIQGKSKLPYSSLDSQCDAGYRAFDNKFYAEATYELENYKKNAMIIFDHDMFDGNDIIKIGGKRDQEALHETFIKLNFTVRTYYNLYASEIFKTVKEFCLQDFTDYGCICAVILTFGAAGQLRARDMAYSEQAFIDCFDAHKNKTFFGKPIIILMQACRGSVFDARDHSTSAPSSDMLIFQSTNIGQNSFRNYHGSFFIQTLCEQINIHANTIDFLTICTLVIKKVKELEDVFHIKQMPVLTSSLLKRLYLRKYGERYLNDSPFVMSNTDLELKASKLNVASSVEINKYRANVDAPTYELERFPRNAMIIFNHEHFLDDKSRKGTEVDKVALKETFEKFRFSVTEHNDLEKRELFMELRKFSKQNFVNCGCVCVAILTHGSDHGYLRAFDKWYSEREVFACFNALANPTLVAKPIVFLIQACRGAFLARPVPVPQSRARPEIELDCSYKREENRCLPTESDLLIIHSSFSGRASARVLEEGSWFIQTLCEQINEHAATEHLEKIGRRIKKIIALEKEYDEGKQVPVTASTLLRKLFLKRIGDI